MAIRAQGRGRLALVALLLGVGILLPTVLHCIPGDKRPSPLAAHHLSLVAPTATAPASDLSAAADHAYADNALRKGLCQGVDGLAAALRGEHQLRPLMALFATIAAAALAVPPFSGISRGPPLRVRTAASPRSGRVLLTDLCISRR
ncbi:hypothetical protein [Mycobacteroides chelonae]|uniref:Uncharacterized protein n=1 Tax=Mycobacteroides chelonae TaxID=1774 RepID=A0A1S1LX62_MYCCH|nr:hypothetical protein [Mycobacteroides chelonae]OHU77374.1 hypothetical protein BKG84_02110 [Mycobacteroides chelonae]QQG87485.1 hypothetical protein HBA99_09835 [Mycobacteroides chelonae]QQG92300.1 hypothetical protein HBA97_09835 [Mycobacteroides chelonae]